MCHKRKLREYAKERGFEIIESPTEIEIRGLPCVISGGTIGRCTVRTRYDAGSEESIGVEGGEHCTEVELEERGDGKVYEANGNELGNIIWTDGERKCRISIKSGKPGEAQRRENVYKCLFRYTKHIVGAAYAKRAATGVWNERRSRLKIPDVYEARAGIREVQNKIRDQKVAILGLGGTGGFILDLVAKTSVEEIHVVDDDHLEWHNLLRAPGAPTEEEKQAIGEARVRKTEYLEKKYQELRTGIVVYAEKATRQTVEKLQQNGVSFVFVSIDQGSGERRGRQEEVYEALEETGIQFVDTGVSIRVEGDKIAGSVQTFTQKERTGRWKTAVPNAQAVGQEILYRNTQLPEVNALAACLAVMEWRRQTGQYAGEETTEKISRFKIDEERIVKG